MVSVDEMGRLGAAGPLLAIVVPDTVRTDMRLVGELDEATESVLAVLVEQQIATGHLQVHIDLSRLDFCGSAVLRACAPCCTPAAGSPPPVASSPSPTHGRC